MREKKLHLVVVNMGPKAKDRHPITFERKKDWLGFISDFCNQKVPCESITIPAVYLMQKPSKKRSKS